ncbi:MAG: DUF1244 domain-containing protein [Pseudomonadota bacterium]
MDKQAIEAAQAAAFRRLLSHLQHRTDVQNIDLMGLGGFCRNCLSDWYGEALEAQGVTIDKAAAREAIYGMPYPDYKEAYQTKATQAQIDAMNASVAKNKA